LNRINRNSTLKGIKEPFIAMANSMAQALKHLKGESGISAELEKKSPGLEHDEPSFSDSFCSRASRQEFKQGHFPYKISFCNRREVNFSGRKTFRDLDFPALDNIHLSGTITLGKNLLTVTEFHDQFAGKAFIFVSWDEISDPMIDGFPNGV
jgi:hypothetical protein